MNREGLIQNQRGSLFAHFQNNHFTKTASLEAYRSIELMSLYQAAHYLNFDASPLDNALGGIGEGKNTLGMHVLSKDIVNVVEDHVVIKHKAQP